MWFVICCRCKKWSIDEIESNKGSIKKKDVIYLLSLMIYFYSFPFSNIQSERSASIQQHRSEDLRRGGLGIVSRFSQWIAVEAQTLAFAQSQGKRAFYSYAHVASRWREYRQAQSFQERTDKRWFSVPVFLLIVSVDRLFCLVVL